MSPGDPVQDFINELTRIQVEVAFWESVLEKLLDPKTSMVIVDSVAVIIQQRRLKNMVTGGKK